MINLPHLNTKFRRKKSLVLHQLKNNGLLTDIQKQQMKQVDENIKNQELKLNRLQTEANRQQTRRRKLKRKQDDVNWNVKLLSQLNQTQNWLNLTVVLQGDQVLMYASQVCSLLCNRLLQLKEQRTTGDEASSQSSEWSPWGIDWTGLQFMPICYISETPSKTINISGGKKAYYNSASEVWDSFQDRVLTTQGKPGKSGRIFFTQGKPGNSGNFVRFCLASGKTQGNLYVALICL